MAESYTLDVYNSGRTVVGDAITELAKNDERIWLLTPDIGWGCNDFKKAHPERFSGSVKMASARARTVMGMPTTLR